MKHDGTLGQLGTITYIITSRDYHLDSNITSTHTHTEREHGKQVLKYQPVRIAIIQKQNIVITRRHSAIVNIGEEFMIKIALKAQDQISMIGQLEKDFRRIID